MPDYRINRNEEYDPVETRSLFPENIRSSPSIFDLPAPPPSDSIFYDETPTPPLPPLIQQIGNNEWEPDCPSFDNLVEKSKEEDES